MQADANSNALVDAYGRSIEYVRLSVTDRCDLRCFYCLPKHYKNGQEPADWLTFDEIERLMQAFASLGTRRIRITGGEPLVRKHLPTLIERINAIDGIDDLSLSTNATQLDKQAEPLYAAGVRRINVSLDTLNAKRFRDITGGDLDRVLAGLQAAKAAGFKPIKINMVALAGINDDEYETMLNYCIENGFTLRFIETMPMGDTGRNATNHYHSLDKLRTRLAKQFDLVPSLMAGGGPARYLRSVDSDFQVGFITPISQHFCASCNRVRLSVDGTLYLCLGQDHSYPLRDLVRQGASIETLQDAIRSAIKLKPEKHEFREKPNQIVRFMASTGG